MSENHTPEPIVYAGLDVYGRCSCGWRCEARSGPECDRLLRQHAAESLRPHSTDGDCWCGPTVERAP